MNVNWDLLGPMGGCVLQGEIRGIELISSRVTLPLLGNVIVE